MTKKNYALVVYINPDHENKDIVDVHICKRIKYSFTRDQKVNRGEQLFLIIDAKENIFKLRNLICDRLNEMKSNRKFVRHTQGSQVHIPTNQ